MLAWYSIIEGGVALAAAFANCINPLPPLSLASKVFLLPDWFSAFLSVPLPSSLFPDRYDSRIPLFRVLFIPTERKSERARKKENERERERKWKDGWEENGEGRSLRHLLFYSLYTLNVCLNAGETFWTIFLTRWTRTRNSRR